MTKHVKNLIKKYSKILHKIGTRTCKDLTRIKGSLTSAKYLGKDLATKYFQILQRS